MGPHMGTAYTHSKVSLCGVQTDALDFCVLPLRMCNNGFI